MVNPFYGLLRNINENASLVIKYRRGIVYEDPFESIYNYEKDP